MDEERIGRFIAHYERLTRWILAEMPPRVDLLIRLDERRRPIAIS
jgi:D-glycerate 3-kinase